jgi:hypothetical protein
MPEGLGTESADSVNIRQLAGNEEWVKARKNKTRQSEAKQAVKLGVSRRTAT